MDETDATDCHCTDYAASELRPAMKELMEQLVRLGQFERVTVGEKQYYRHIEVDRESLRKSIRRLTLQSLGL